MRGYHVFMKFSDGDEIMVRVEATSMRLATAIAVILEPDATVIRTEDPSVGVGGSNRIIADIVSAEIRRKDEDDARIRAIMAGPEPEAPDLPKAERDKRYRDWLVREKAFADGPKVRKYGRWDDPKRAIVPDDGFADGGGRYTDDEMDAIALAEIVDDAPPERGGIYPYGVPTDLPPHPGPFGRSNNPAVKTWPLPARPITAKTDPYLSCPRTLGPMPAWVREVWKDPSVRENQPDITGPITLETLGRCRPITLKPR